jgi:hypothetical protein
MKPENDRLRDWLYELGEFLIGAHKHMHGKTVCGIGTLCPYIQDLALYGKEATAYAKEFKQ